MRKARVDDVRGTSCDRTTGRSRRRRLRNSHRTPAMISHGRGISGRSDSVARQTSDRRCRKPIHRGRFARLIFAPRSTPTARSRDECHAFVLHSRGSVRALHEGRLIRPRGDASGSRRTQYMYRCHVLTRIALNWRCRIRCLVTMPSTARESCEAGDRPIAVARGDR